MSTGAALNLPASVSVRADAAGRPRMVDGLAVEALRESWLVEDRWWTARPLRRRYWELVGVGGQNLVVFHELPPVVGLGAVAESAAARDVRGGWFVQRA
jgi:hypothetical protein